MRLSRLVSRRAVPALMALLALGALLIVQAEPAMAALACPRCMGFQHLDGPGEDSSIYVDPAMSEPARAQFLRTVAAGEARVSAYLGGLRGRPVILACASHACAERMGGDALGTTYALLGMRFSPFGLDPVIVAHERTHVEVHRRIGLWRQLTGALPVWFDEGLAVLVSDDPRYLRPRGPGDRCLAEPAPDLPDGALEWARRAGADHGLYASAACRVVRWGERHGGRTGLLQLIADVGAGARFDAIWARPPSGDPSAP